MITGPQYLLEAPQAPVVSQASLPSRLDELYAPHFRRLERDLETREARSSHLKSSEIEPWAGSEPWTSSKLATFFIPSFDMPDSLYPGWITPVHKEG